MLNVAILLSHSWLEFIIASILMSDKTGELLFSAAVFFGLLDILLKAFSF